VTVSGNPVGNLDDSTPLITSNATHNGTREFGTGLDLTGVASPGSNRLALFFDQNVNVDELGTNCPSSVANGACWTTDFTFYTGNGDLHGNSVDLSGGDPNFFGPQIIAVTDNLIVVQYNPASDSVADSRIGLVLPRAEVCGPSPPSPFCNGNNVESDTWPGGSKRTSLGSEPIAGQPGAGNTARIELQQPPVGNGADVLNGGNSNQIAFHFESPVALGPAAPDCFTATTSNTRRLFGDAAVVNGNTVTVTFNGMQLISELVTRAGVEAPDPDHPRYFDQQFNCVNSVSTQVGNSMGSAPVGGNIGAVGTGYTTGPDSLGFGPIDQPNGQVNVRIDQRADDTSGNIVTGCVNLLDNQGNFLQNPSNAFVTGNGDPNVPHSVTFTFDPLNVANMAGIQLDSCALRTFPGSNEFDAEFNIDQVFAL